MVPPALSKGGFVFVFLSLLIGLSSSILPSFLFTLFFFLRGLCFHFLKNKIIYYNDVKELGLWLSG